MRGAHERSARQAGLPGYLTPPAFLDEDITTVFDTRSPGPGRRRRREGVPGQYIEVYAPAFAARDVKLLRRIVSS